MYQKNYHNVIRLKEEGTVCMASAEVFVNQEGMALFNCPHCGKMKHVSVAKFKDVKHSLQVKCSCNKTFHVDLNFRKRFRKKTDLNGFFAKINKGKAVHHAGKNESNCKIVNISLGGIGLQILEEQKITAGDELAIDFTLDNKQKSEINRTVVVRHVGEGGYVGGEFNDSDDRTYEKTLGFYLMP